jgi:hypothetical protein
MGLQATDSIGEKIHEGVTGRYTDSTTWYIVGGDCRDCGRGIAGDAARRREVARVGVIGVRGVARAQ